MYAEHARRQLDEQHTALEQRLTGPLPAPGRARPAGRGRTRAVRIALAQPDDLRAAERAYTLAVEQDARST